MPVVGVYETMPTPGYDYQSWMLAEVAAIRGRRDAQGLDGAPVIAPPSSASGDLGSRATSCWRWTASASAVGPAGPRWRHLRGPGGRVHRTHRLERGRQDDAAARHPRPAATTGGRARARRLVSGADRSVGYVPQKVLLDPDIPLRARDLVALGLDGQRYGFGCRTEAPRARSTRCSTPWTPSASPTPGSATSRGASSSGS